jgi:hypothetical protein
MRYFIKTLFIKLFSNKNKINMKFEDDIENEIYHYVNLPHNQATFKYLLNPHFKLGANAHNAHKIVITFSVAPVNTVEIELHFNKDSQGVHHLNIYDGIINTQGLLANERNIILYELDIISNRLYGRFLRIYRNYYP